MIMFSYTATALFSVTTVFFLLSLCFVGLGVYSTDLVLMIIAALFALAGLLFQLEMRECLLNPFTD